MIFPVILCGGSGTRLWPLSRESSPKQFLRLTGEHSLLQNTALRTILPSNSPAPIIVCNNQHRFQIAAQLQEINLKPECILLEPSPKNTAPAAAIATFYAQSQAQDPVLLVMPADHSIGNNDALQQAINAALPFAEAGKIVTFGIHPDRAHTGYGYIELGQALEQSEQSYELKRFVEKPDQTTAEQYIASQRFCWNSGLFMFKASAYLNALKQHANAIFTTCQQAINDAEYDMDFIRITDSIFRQCPSDSIDYAVMEHIQNGIVIKLDAGWSDIGSFSALYDISAHDHDKNVCHGQVVCNEVNNCYLHSDNRLLTAIGLKDLVVVDTNDALLVAHKSQTEKVKDIVNQLKQQNIRAALEHSQVFRPWGHYETLDIGERFQVKRITVNPGGRLSLQLHRHRSEHWIVVSGTAKVTRGEEGFQLVENQSTYIPQNTKHRLENLGDKPLHIIEVQTGEYLGEDDIIRFDDVYGRVEDESLHN